MKKALIIIVIVALGVFGWYKLSKTRLPMEMLRGKKAVVGRGDLSIPISGTGEIQPRSRAEIKPEASGAVIEVPVIAGKLVKKGEALIRLDPEDEQRNVSRAENDVARSNATLDQQKLRLEERKTSSIAQIDARIKAIVAQISEAEFRLNKFKAMPEGVRSKDEIVRAQSRYDQLAAQHEQFLADRRQAEIAIELAERDVTLASKALETAQTTLSDARERLRETEICSPIDGMVSELKVEVGEVVQSGRTTITGGTVLAKVADISELYVRTEVSDADIGTVLWLAAPAARPGGQTLATELEEANIPLMTSTAGIAEHLNAPGTPVTIHVDSFRDDEFEGIIERIYPEPRKIQNIVTYIVDIRVTSENRRKLALVLGMQADVEFTAEAVQGALLVPHEAIRRGPSGELGVYVPEKVEGQPEPRPKFIPCRFGLDNGLFAELTEGEGVTEGTEVYVKMPPQFKTKDEDDE